MSENIILALIVVSGGSVVSLGAFLFGTTGSNNKSNFESFLEAWRDKRLAEIELKKIQAQHERTCPRLTDKPRGT